jgi:U3 small nucleolar RNA-associated protein 18
MILSAATKQWIAEFKMNSGVVTVAFGADNNLWSLGLDGSIYLWDLKTMECIKQFNDQGCIRASALHVSPDGKWIAAGSSSGVLNLYEVAKIDSEYPEPSKVFMNLTTSISHILFHPSSDLIVIASNDVKDALRIIHIPTLKVVKNWPTALTPLSYIFSVAFSHDGQYLAVGNDKGKALLFRLGAFSDPK